MTVLQPRAYTEPSRRYGAHENASMRIQSSHWPVRALAFAAAFTAAGLVRPSVSATQAGDRERTLFVSAVDDKGQPVSGLGAEDFVVREDGVRREVLRVSRAIEPIDIALLVDNSASADEAVVSMRDGLRRFVETMAGPHQIAIIALADRPTILVDYTTDKTRLEAGIGRIFSQPQSGMTMLDAIVEVSQGLRKREASRAVIVPVINDGIEFTNRHSRDVLESVRRAGASLHAVTIGAFYVSVDDVDRERALVLDTVTRDTGGQRITLLNHSAIRDALARLAAELSSQYKVVYGRPQSLIPPDAVAVSSGRPGVTMRAAPMRGQPGA